MNCFEVSHFTLKCLAYLNIKSVLKEKENKGKTIILKDVPLSSHLAEIPWCSLWSPKEARSKPQTKTGQNWAWWCHKPGRVMRLMTHLMRCFLGEEENCWVQNSLNCTGEWFGSFMAVEGSDQGESFHLKSSWSDLNWPKEGKVEVFLPVFPDEARREEVVVRLIMYQQPNVKHWVRPLH